MKEAAGRNPETRLDSFLLLFFMWLFSGFVLSHRVELVRRARAFLASSPSLRPQGSS